MMKGVVMKRRLRDFIVKLFSLVLAIIMCIPTNVYALGIDETEEAGIMISNKFLNDKGEKLCQKT